jgi:hypothetical protein
VILNRNRIWGGDSKQAPATNGRFTGVYWDNIGLPGFRNRAVSNNVIYSVKTSDCTGVHYNAGDVAIFHNTIDARCGNLTETAEIFMSPSAAIRSTARETRPGGVIANPFPRIFNNILIGNFCAISYELGTAALEIVPSGVSNVHHNVIYSPEGSSIAIPIACLSREMDDPTRADYATLDNVYVNGAIRRTDLVSNTELNPLFESLSGRDYRLKVGSVAINAGSTDDALLYSELLEGAAPAPKPIRDITLYSRPVTQAYDCGAYEYRRPPRRGFTIGTGQKSDGLQRSVGISARPSTDDSPFMEGEGDDSEGEGLQEWFRRLTQPGGRSK